MAERTRQIVFGLGWAGVAILIWSGSFVSLRLGVTTSLNAYDLTALRFAVASMFLTPILWRHGLGRVQLGLAGMAAMAGTFGAPYILLVSLAMRTAPASSAGALNPGVMAIASVILGRVMFGEKTSAMRLVGVCLTALGIFFMRAGGALVTGDAILVVTGMMWAGYATIARWGAVPALTATAIVAVGSAVVYLPIYVVVLPKRIATAPLADILVQAGFQGVLVSVVALYAFNRSRELLGPVVSATLPALVPVVTLGLGVLVLGEAAWPDEIVAAGLITLGLTVIVIGPRAAWWFQARFLSGCLIGPQP